MSHEIIIQLLKSTENILNSRHGALYAVLISLTSFSLGYLWIDNKYKGSSNKEECYIPIDEPEEKTQE